MLEPKLPPVALYKTECSFEKYFKKTFTKVFYNEYKLPAIPLQHFAKATRWHSNASRITGIKLLYI